MSAQPRSVLLVGERFAGFTVHEDVFTPTQFIARLPLLDVFLAPDARVPVRVGQGVSPTEWASVRAVASRLGLDGRLEFNLPYQVLSPEREVHKKQVQNTLIADLRRVDTDLFRADLRLHNDNELLLDHQTGQHVQGMVAVEAARQMFLAVSERYYASRYPDRSYYYVIESMNTSFENFLFPLDATVEFRTVKAETDDPGRLAFAAEIALHQAGRRSSLTTVAYSAFEPELIGAKETRRARHAVDHADAADRTLVTA